MSDAVARLEAAFAEWLGVPGAVATGYGRGAIWLAVRAPLEGAGGGEVLLPDFICAQVPHAVQLAGGVPAYFPVQRDLTVREADLAAAITPETRAAILVHYYGRALPGIERLAALCRERGVVVIEDCALALGARSASRRVGSFGDLAAFSFTKSDWCYGGGVVVAARSELCQRLRELREGNCRPARRLAFCYGALRRVDFAANRPGRARLAGHAGRWLERGMALLEPSLRGNFFDAGRCDARMPPFAARRGLRILRGLDADIARRRAAQASLAEAIRSRIPGAAKALQPFPGRDAADEGDTGAFLLMRAVDGCVADWVERADAAGFTLRLSWPAYQRNDGHSLQGASASLQSSFLLAETLHQALKRSDAKQFSTRYRHTTSKSAIADYNPRLRT